MTSFPIFDRNPRTSFSFSSSAFSPKNGSFDGNNSGDLEGGAGRGESDGLQRKTAHIENRIDRSLQVPLPPLFHN